MRKVKIEIDLSWLPKKIGAGFKFTLTGLEESSTYRYSFVAKSSSGSELNTYTGTFTTKAYTPVDNIFGDSKQEVQKVIENGQLIIIRDGVHYNALGTRIQ